MAVVVVDASLAVKWLLPEEGSARALELAERWTREGVQAVVPTLFWSEVGNVLYQRVRQGHLDVSQADRLLKELLDFGLTTRSEVAFRRPSLQIAARYRLPSLYDAVYLALAEAEDAALWTADGRLHRTMGGKARVHLLG